MRALTPPLRALLVALALVLLTATSASANGERDPPPHVDPSDAPSSPLDLQSVTFGQRGTELLLRMTTAGEWTPDQLDPAAGRSLCVYLFYGKLRTPQTAICFAAAGTEPVLLLTRLDPAGMPVPGGTRLLDTIFQRADNRSIEATFTLGDAALGLGRYSWQAASQWTCEVPAECLDLVPSGGNVVARTQPLAEPRCFGAAARNPRHRCSNPAFRLAVIPEPVDAVIAPNSGCTVISAQIPKVCQFGLRKESATANVALIGDSHATHWRGAIEVVAQARRWRGLSMTRAGCPLSTAVADIPNPARRRCTSWRSAVRRLLARRPSVRTLFVSQHAGAGVRVARGRNEYEAQVNGYIKAWRRLPSTVRRIIVIRDPPMSTQNSLLCVQQAIAARKRPGLACAISRSRVLRRDPAAEAARRMHSRRVRLVDFTPFICSRRLCFPVVGGALVHKDLTHITSVFAATIGPYLLRKVNGIVP